MEKREWYIKIEGKQQGPYKPSELKALPHLTPDSLVRKEDEQRWTEISKVIELSWIFDEEDSEDTDNVQDKDFLFQKDETQQDSELVLDLNSPSPSFWFIIFLLIALLLQQLYLSGII